MRRSDLRRIWALGLVLTCAPLAHGQGNKGLPTTLPKNAAKTAAEAARILEKAKANRELEAARQAEAAASSKRLDAAAERARAAGVPQPSFAEQERDAESKKRLEEAMSRVSPEGQAILAQNTTTPTLRAPSDSQAPGGVGAKASPLTASGPGPKPQPLKPTPLTPVEKPPVRTVVDADSAFFDSKAGFGVFVGDVVLNHPSVHLTSDELEIYMNKGEPEDAGTGKGAPPATGPSAGALAQDNAATAPLGKGESAPSERLLGGDIKTAIARGRKVQIIRMSADGVPQIGMGREAVYDGATGDMTLRGWPQIQEGTQVQVATEPSTYFVIKNNGHFQAFGRSRTDVVRADPKKAVPPPPPIPAPPVPAPSGNPQGTPQ